MTNLLILLVAVNWLVYAVLFGLRTRAAARYPTDRLRKLGWVGASVCALFLLGASQRLGIHLAVEGLLPEQVAEYMTSVGQLVLSLVVTTIVLSGVYTVSRVGGEVARVDRMVSILSSRIPEGLSVTDLGLTARELQVLERMSVGNVSDTEIAAAMSISPATAATHVRNILRKAGISNRRDLMLLATEEPALIGVQR